MTLMTPIDHFNLKLILEQKLPQELINDLIKTMNQPLIWGVVNLEKVPDRDKLKDTRVWEAKQGRWHFVLSDFSIADQPNRQPGDRGQNMLIVGPGTGLIGDDGFLLHEIARMFVEKLDFGYGK